MSENVHFLTDYDLSTSQIGRTSALAMSLTGILKSILLVAVSMLIWHTPMTLLQAIGYLIALVAMFYYSMGGVDQAKSHVTAGKAWLVENSKTLFSSGQSYQVVPTEAGGPRAIPEDLERGQSGANTGQRCEENERLAAQHG
ncbi:hypothetical protein TruAng_001218 [Truncatella angustata]|nr:hypothetical protein TruAng_001218 [Truncatella angustata]